MSEPHYTVTHWSRAQAQPDYRNKPAQVVTVNDRAATREAIITLTRRRGGEFVPRSDWAAHKSKSIDLKDDWDYKQIAIHTAGRSYSCGPGALQLQQIQEMHMDKKDKADIGYHYAIDCFGNVYEGRDIRFKGEHLNAYNTGVIGIVLLENLMESKEGNDWIATVKRATKAIVGLKEPTVPSAQEESLLRFIKVLQEFFNIKILGGHREFPHQEEGEGHTCPGNVGLQLVSRLRSATGLAKPAG
ncbi:N-acetylmuramoyl-L-alanine amidase [Paludibacterium sp. B53371]|uniref:N-acetylmuramoyl-L-alanine amidase n=1 Tax=Paludibacterium sp. B53371 TaxID=2806263 RepID=UPI001C04C21E|nr:N-acetylmuramoyl-L-alanine amidase [Paludibacterium sp. B53371]